MKVNIQGSPAGVEFRSDVPYIETTMQCHVCHALIFTFNLLDTQEKMAKEAYWHTMSQEHIANAMKTMAPAWM